MESQIIYISEELNEFLQKKETELIDFVQDVPPIVSELEQGLAKLREIVCNYIFPSAGSEIQFFKEIKPKLFSKLLFLQKIYQLKLNEPILGYSILKSYWESVLEQIRIFYSKNIEFIQYYRSGKCYLDGYYFVRGKNEMRLTIDCYYFERDFKFSTCFDFKVSQILANDMIASFVNYELTKINQDSSNTNISFGRQSKEQWTETKVALAELIYGIYLARSVNAGNVDIKNLASIFSKAFNIDLSDIYHTFLEMRGRKGNRTIYLSKLIEALNKRMDELDGK